MHNIPESFYSFESKQPFERCISCDRYLLDDETEYFIEKALRTYPGFGAQDVIFDFAICMHCAEEFRNKISRESEQSMISFFQQNVDFSQRMKMMEQHPDRCIEHCMVSGRAAADCTEYQLVAHCKGNRIHDRNPPYMISGEVIEKLGDVLSRQTKDEMDGFLDRFFSPDPSLFETKPRLVLV